MGKRRISLKNKAALSPVVANLILCATVITIGISVWSFTFGATNVLQTNYYEDMKKEIDTIKERFVVEHVAYSNESDLLHVWIYNYGDVDVEVNVYVYMDGNFLGKNETFTSISSKTCLDVTVSLSTKLSVGNELVIEVMSRRQNVVYEVYVVPVI